MVEIGKWNTRKKMKMKRRGKKTLKETRNKVDEGETMNGRAFE